MKEERGSTPGEYNPMMNYGHRREEYRITTIGCKRCCCCALVVLAAIAVVLGGVALAVVLILKPKKPEFHLQNVKVQSIMVEPPPVWNMPVFLSMNITMIFSALNPNKVGIKYSPVNMYVMFKGMRIGVAVVPPFYQASYSNTTLVTQLLVKRVNILQAAALDLFREATVNDRVRLRVTGDVGAQIRLVQITSPKVEVSVDCQIVLSPQHRSLTGKTCGVDGLNF